ncbi:MAG: ResB protein required for cytochrome C biosynthesis, partial [Verrucomicrobiota bacterium]
MSAKSSPTRPTPEPTGPVALWRLPLKVLSSLRLTVVLLAFSIAVVFFGTLAQTEDGLYLAQAKYFRSYWAVWSPHAPDWRWLKIPLPGGYLLGFLLLANLLAAHLTRFQFTWKKSGIFLTHIGIILLLIGQLTTDMFARESRMRFAEGEFRNYTEGFQESEIAVLTDAPDASMDQVVAFPQPLLRSGAELQNASLPFRLRLVDYHPNSDPELRNDPKSGEQFSGVGREFEFKGIPETHEMDSKNVPSAVVEVAGTDGKSLGRWA